MPREARHARVSGVRQTSGMYSPAKSSLRQPLRMPLNDDKEEKAVRFQSRQALQEMHLNHIKAAAASPVRIRRSLGTQDQSSPLASSSQDKENEGDALAVVSGNAVTPMKRVPILANFEEWMKMATDNVSDICRDLLSLLALIREKKINAANSWNFALIDYFHDMSLLREGDSVNFQKASCTLDGCVKIYTSRVDSVATETGKLLSGLADSGNSKKRKGDGDNDNEGEDDADGDEGEEGEEGVEKRAKKRKQRSSETTLVASFAQLQLKKMDLEFSVDPLFKKASADFDEGGAKGLLLNHLTVDSEGRIVFDSSDDIKDMPDSEELQPEDGKAEAVKEEADEQDIDIGSLTQRFFPDLSRIDEQDVCPSLRTFELGGASSSMDIPFLRADDWKKEHDVSQDQMDIDGRVQLTAPNAYDDEDNDVGGGFDVLVDEIGFGEGGEAWAREAAIESQPRPVNMSPDDENADGEAAEFGDFDSLGNSFGIHLQKRATNQEQNILSYFDTALSQNWAGPEHWRIQKIKDLTKPSVPTRQRKEKEPFEIDFLAPLSRELKAKIYTPAPTNSSISLPKAQWKSKTRNLLPDDKHFNSKDLLSLFLKPKARIGARRSRASVNKNLSSSMNDIPQNAADMDPSFWARRHAESSMAPAEDEGVQGNYDANFFADDGLGATGLPDDDDEDALEFADAQEHLPPAADAVDSIQPGELGPVNDAGSGGYGNQLVTQSRRIRPEYVTYAKVAKKVDVRRLKEEMWRGIGFETLAPPSSAKDTPAGASEDQAMQIDSEHDNDESLKKEAAASEEEKSLRFTSVMNDLQRVYPKQAMADISTSYCFICLLHLANEKGLVLNHDGNLEEIRISKDRTAEIAEGAPD